MSPFQVFAVVLTLSAAFAYVNQRSVRLPPGIGIMAMSLVVSTVMILVDKAGIVALRPALADFVARAELGHTLLHGMLGALLFAGALHVDLGELRRERATVLGLSFVGTLLSTALVGFGFFAVSRVVGVGVTIGYALLFGALVSPTDPVAVLGILKAAKVPKRLETQIAGESLLNDGVGVVVFGALVGVVVEGRVAHAGDVAVAFVREAIGGAAFGAFGGYVTYRLLRSIDHYQTELLLTLALVFGGYALAERLHVSAPLASVVSGLIIGNAGREHGMSDVTRDHLDKFWALVDDVLNAVLFVLVGLELTALPLAAPTLGLGALAVIVVLLARFVSVAVPLTAMRRVVQPVRGTIPVLTWGGVRGGISIALALSLPPSDTRDVVLTVTYVVVVFSVLVQGLTLGAVAKRFVRGAEPA
ncbi:MAG: sodium:proton antiporter [Myxococcales bacterium]|nr:sodium:proton antiporter [Myxococcales bacterium]